MKRLTQPWLTFEPFLKISQAARDMRIPYDAICNTIKKIVKEKQHLRVESDEKQGIFIKQLLNLKNNFDDEDMRDEAGIFVIAVS